jgi:hypothetical protein
MKDNSFVVTINDTDYIIKLRSAVPRLYDVLCGAAYHQIGKTDAGLWVYVETPASIQHMPLQEIGEAIDEHAGPNSEETY